MRTLLTLSLLALLAGCAADEPADLTAYIEEIRAAGITEAADSQLRTVANAVCGYSTIAYTKDPESGSYWTSINSNVCYDPSLERSEEEWAALRAEETARLDAVLVKLLPMADTDGSGFVSTDEGNAFRNLNEFGWKYPVVLEGEDGDVAAMAAAFHLDPEALAARLDEYDAYAARATAAGLEGFAPLERH